MTYLQRRTLLISCIDILKQISQIHQKSQLLKPASRASTPALRSGSNSPLRPPRSPRPQISTSHYSPAISGSPALANGHVGDQKEAADWHVEGPGRRVGYDDLTAIDWIFEYTKERQRLRSLLSGTQGFSRALRQVIDGSHVWFVLVATGVAVGFVAAGISIASDWLGDIKQGYCTKGEDDGRFYLNRQFCCWGHDDLAQCQDWTPWREALKIPSVGGGYVVEYMFFILFSTVFAVAAALLVKSYSPYAKQSGIPEIKTVLGGFVIRRFMGAWTLVTKSVGLVRQYTPPCLDAYRYSVSLWLQASGSAKKAP